MAITGESLTNGIIKIAENVNADDKLKIGGILYLEEKLGKSFEEIADGLAKSLEGKVTVTTMVKTIEPFLIALIIQRNPDLDEEAIRSIIHDLDLAMFTGIFDKVKMFESPAKNAPGPNAKKTRKRQPIKK